MGQNYFEQENHLSQKQVSSNEEAMYVNNSKKEEKATPQDLEQQRLKFTTILDATTEGLYELDLAGRCTFINRAALDFLGYREEECLGKEMHQLVHYNHPDGSPYPLDKCPFIKSLTSGKQIKLVEEVLWHKNGSPLPTLYSCSPIFENGQIVGGVVTISDLREPKKAQALIQETEARFRVIWQSASDAVALSDPEGTVIEANPAYYTLYGYPPEQVIGQNFSIIFPEEIREVARAQYDETFRGPKTVQAIESVIKRADGTERVVEASYDFITQNGIRTAMVSVVRDITERKQAQEALQKVLFELKQFDQLKDEFVSLVIHDLRTPLTAISGYAHLLKRNQPKVISDKGTSAVEKDDVEELANQLLAPKNSKSIEAILHQTQRMEELISRLLEFSRIQAGKLTLNYNRQGNLLNLVRTVVEDHKVTTEEHEIEFEVPGFVTEIVTSFDAARLEQVLNNLISNATKYSPRGSKITVGLDPQPDAAKILVWVKDQGYGISQEAQAHLFERYYREYTAETKGTQGLGLGLYISNEIIKEHGGRLWVESQSGEGSTFYFTLPF
ncbi:MAG TPA: PAS domain S-box protein [Chloroflexia bacterium]|nr:PAS domain S-box protein [Chloroflexia bacterium]